MIEIQTSLPFAAEFLTKKHWSKITTGELVVAIDKEIDNEYFLIGLLENGITETRGTKKIVVEGTHEANFSMKKQGADSQITSFSDRNCKKDSICHVFTEHELFVLERKDTLLEMFSGL